MKTIIGCPWSDTTKNYQEILLVDEHKLRVKGQIGDSSEFRSCGRVDVDHKEAIKVGDCRDIGNYIGESDAIDLVAGSELEARLRGQAGGIQDVQIVGRMECATGADSQCS